MTEFKPGDRVRYADSSLTQGRYEGHGTVISFPADILRGVVRVKWDDGFSNCFYNIDDDYNEDGSHQWMLEHVDEGVKRDD